jgi:hypothetical protein
MASNARRPKSSSACLSSRRITMKSGVWRTCSVVGGRRFVFRQGVVCPVNLFPDECRRLLAQERLESLHEVATGGGNNLVAPFLFRLVLPARLFPVREQPGTFGLRVAAYAPVRPSMEKSREPPARIAIWASFPPPKPLAPAERLPVARELPACFPQFVVTGVPGFHSPLSLICRSGLRQQLAAADVGHLNLASFKVG